MDQESLRKVLDQLVSEAEVETSQAQGTWMLMDTKAKYLGKEGSISSKMKDLAKLPQEDRPKFGAIVNEAKSKVEALVNKQKEAILAKELEQKLAAESLDVTLPGRSRGKGGLHPITLAQERIEQLFHSMGFSVADGPEIETDYFNFTALNTPEKHPARSMQDTFYIANSSHVLRTQTSPVQIRYMQEQSKRGGPPIRIICPGRVYRCDHDATHSPMFHQIEGLWVDEGISLADLKGTVTQFLRGFFERDDINIRFRPSYFPFVEPGVEIDMEWSREGDEIKWLEIAGAGVVHPQVLRNGGIDPEKYSGFAFGMGLDRLAMLRYGVNDLRLFFENDLRFLRQFA